MSGPDKKLCGFGWVIGNIVPLVFDTQGTIYNNNGIDFSSLSHLESLGLIRFDSFAGFKRLRFPKNFEVFYFGMPLELTFPNDAGALHLGNVLLTRAGQELAPICDSKAVDGFFDFVYDTWAKQSFVPTRQTEQGAAQVS